MAFGETGDIAPNAISAHAVKLENRDIGTSLLLHEAAARLAPEDPDIKFKFHLALERANEHDRSVEVLASAVHSAPDQDSLHLKLIDIATQHHRDRTSLRPLLDKSVERAQSSEAVARMLAVKLLEVEEMETVLACSKQALGSNCLYFRQDDSLVGKYSVVLDFHSGGYGVRMARDFLPWGWLLDRLFSYRVYLDRLCVTNGPRGVATFCLGDFPEEDREQLVFCSDQEEHALIPDPFFIGSEGYQFHRQVLDSAMQRFSKREDTLYWRGSLTGQAHDYKDIMALPRVAFCLMSLFRKGFDAKLTDLSQFGPLLPTLHNILVALDVCGPREDVSRNCEFKYLVDIDGNTNSWPGLWQKLYSGGVVIKLRSQYRQWYYDRLVDQKNVLYVDELFPDIDTKLSWCRENPSSAKSIASEGQKMVSKMTLETEYPTFKEAVQRICRPE